MPRETSSAHVAVLASSDRDIVGGMQNRDVFDQPFSLGSFSG
jgi:hypothetical protein